MLPLRMPWVAPGVAGKSGDWVSPTIQTRPDGAIAIPVVDEYPPTPPRYDAESTAPFGSSCI